MNIKNRLEKLEKTSNLDSEFCTCPREIVTRVIEPDLDRTEEQYQQLLTDAQRPEKCDQCHKLIEKQLIIVEGVRGNERPKMTD